MLADYHMHTRLSDGQHTHLEMLRAAERRGLREIGFSDHICLIPVGWAMPLDSIPLMLAGIAQAQGEAPDGLRVRVGIEVDYIPGRERDIERTIRSVSPDYAIGSVHFIGGWNFDSHPDQYQGVNIDEVFRQYFGLVQQSARSGLFDVIGHCDLIKKFGHSPSFPLDPLYDATARVFKESGVVVELNTSGLGKPCQEFYPSPSFLSRLAHHGVPITLGSDAHHDQRVGQYFPQAVSALKALGYKEIITFQGRARGAIAL